MTAAIFCLNAPASRGAGGRWPTQPTIIRPGPHKPWQFPDNAHLARHVHRHRRGRGMRLASSVATYGGSDTFPCFEVFWVYDQHEEYAFTIAGVGGLRERLEAILADANPDIPLEAPRGAYCA